MKKKRLLSLLACAALMLTLLPITARAADDVTIFEGGTYELPGHNTTIYVKTTVPVTIKGSYYEFENVQINCDEGVSITLESVYIENDNACPLSFTGLNNKLTLVDCNILDVTGDQPGVKVEAGTSLEITGPGRLDINSGFGAGIGGGRNGDGGTVRITGGTVVSFCSTGAGIGGGRNGNGGNVYISGGTVMASSGAGAGIGGGEFGDGGNVYISGGSVNAASAGGQSIGHGDGGSDSGTLMNKPAADGGVNVYLTKVTLESAPGTAVSNAEINLILASLLDAPYGYGTNDMYTDANGILYLYLPENTTTTAARTTDGAATPTYRHYTGSVVTTSGGVTGQLDRRAFTVTTNNAGGYTYDALGVLNIGTAGSYTVSMATPGAETTTDRIVCAANAQLTLNGVNIDLSSGDGCAFELQGTAAVELTLADGTGNSLKSDAPYAGLQVPENASLTIGGTGTLTAEGIYDAVNGQGAGIGGSSGGNGGSITITGGTVTAESFYGAGIGGGSGGNGGSITINGGTVTATSGGGAGVGFGDGGTVTINGGTVTATGVSGAGIGGGGFGSGGTVTINGGTVTATSVEGAGIGGGNNGNGGSVNISGGSVKAISSNGSRQGIGHGVGGHHDSGTLKNKPEAEGGDDVFLTTVTLSGGAAAEAAVSSITANLNGAPYSYGTNGMKTDGSGKLYLYLPKDTLTTAAETQTSKYKATAGVIKTKDDGSAAGVLYLDEAGGGYYYEPVYRANDSGGGTLEVKVDISSGSASVTVTDTLGDSIAGGGDVTITMPSIPGVTSYSLGIPVAYLSTPGGGTLTFMTGTGSMKLPADMLAGIPGAEGKKAEITIGIGDKSGLPDDVKAAIGDRPLIELSLTLDGRQTDWNNPGSPVTVSIPYTPTAEELENPESIVVWYIDGGGNPVCIPNGRYDPLTGTVTFSTTHFSLFAAGYNNVRFGDVEAGVWYEKAVSFIAARGITGGTGGGNFSPDALLTRGEFIVMLMRAYGIAPDFNPTDNFSDAGDAYCTGYLAAAKRLGISSGVGDNMFAPDRTITRQEMFTLLYNALKAVGKLPDGAPGPALNDFTDAGSVADWAYDALAMLVETGVVSGSGGKLNPTGATTRAEMARTLFNLLG